jgi:lysozyme
MNVSQVGINLIKSFEGCRLSAYQDVGGVWTIGYGHTAGVRSNDVISQEQAESLLKSDIESFANAVNDLVHVPLNQYQFDSLVSFTYNVGIHAFATSTLLQMLNAGDYSGASNQFDLWVHAGQKVIQGLVTRRNAEKTLFNKVVEIPVQSQNTYTVQSGDNLTHIANRFGKTVSELVTLNGISNPNLIQVGQVLRLNGSVPHATTQNYTIRSGENLSVIASRMGTSVNAILALNPSIKNRNLVYAGQVIKVPSK